MAHRVEPLSMGLPRWPWWSAASVNKPRWKTTAEFVFNAVATLIGSSMMVAAIKGELLFDVLPSWLYFVFGALVFVVSYERMKRAWNEL